MSRATFEAPYNDPMAIFHRGNSDGDVEQAPILALAHGFVMVHSLATSQAGQNVRFFVLTVRRL